MNLYEYRTRRTQTANSTNGASRNAYALHAVKVRADQMRVAELLASGLMLAK